MERKVGRELFLTVEVDLEIKIVHYLFNADRFVSITELSTVFDEAVPKITKILQKLEDDIENNKDENIQLLKVKRSGVHLALSSEIDMKEFISYLLLSSPLIALLDALLSNKFISVVNYAQNNYISEATVRRYLGKIRSYIEQYGIDIQERDFSIEGSESQIRIFMMLFYWRINQGVGWPFKYVSESNVERIVDYLCDEKNGLSRVSRIERRRMMFYIAITLIRTREKKYIQMNYDLEIENNPFFNKFFENFSGLKKEIFLSKDELLFHYEIWKIFLWTNDIDRIINIEKKEQTSISQSVDTALSIFQEKFFTLSEDVIKQIEPFLYATHTVVSLFENLTTDLNGYHYLKKIERYFPELNRRIREFIKSLYEMTKNKIFLEENYLTIYYWMLFSHFNKAYMYEKKTNMLLETDIPQVLWAPFRQIIEEHFDSKYNIKVYTSDMEFDVDKIDIILSTNTIEGIDKDYPNTQIIAINREVKNRDLNRIEEFLLNNLV
ncbi:TPA: helix-turn-helix domain-containing protein [Enterococcus faecalis]|nr:helix-turn-helix domain-containing protein [Enterococcus faecalis]HBI1784139.1 helix-turn-helix domain-containing protein [Enterococcus faecalis]HBI1786734.1 helix-turn-helix domain-containing protein [Enterococcus faecalis]HBI1792108.1 helix-turn-helix domain-containing protein [Enterococcus faecalis]HBI1888026.1 helix-turn-helix domain-containing protein [Enterococcus faecalis]